MSFPAMACFAPKSSFLFDVTASISYMIRSSPSILPPNRCRNARLPVCVAASTDALPEPESNDMPRTARRTSRRRKEVSRTEKADNELFPATIPRKPKRGRRSEADAVEDFVRNSLERTFSTVRERNPEIFENKEKGKVMKDRDPQNDVVNDSDDEDKEEGEMVMEDEDPNWPLDSDVGWGIRASEYFENHPIKNVVGEDGTVIDWEGETDDNWVQEINCLEWEAFAFHPSPLVVLVFERYNRATDNWKTLKELEKAIRVYWDSKDRLPPRAIKIDMNIEKDLAYALKAKECPQILFLRGNRILYREKEFRTADELVHMIAHFYYNAKRPSCINDANVLPRH